MKKTQRKRRVQAKTDYLVRLNLLKSEKPRVVFRKTNKYFVVQYVKSSEAKDTIVFGITSRTLVKFGWPENLQGSLKSITASYLTGYLFAKEISKRKLEIPIVDFGMIRTLHKSKPFAFIKGLIDGGLKISCDKEYFPEEERIQGKSLREDFSSKFKLIKSNIEKK